MFQNILCMSQAAKFNCKDKLSRRFVQQSVGTTFLKELPDFILLAILVNMIYTFLLLYQPFMFTINILHRYFVLGLEEK